MPRSASGKPRKYTRGNTTGVNLWPIESMYAKQAGLALDTTESDLPGLRAAYQDCNELHGKYSFDQALEIPALRTALRNMAEAMARRAKHPVESRLACGGGA